MTGDAAKKAQGARSNAHNDAPIDRRIASGTRYAASWPLTSRLADFGDLRIATTASTIAAPPTITLSVIGSCSSHAAERNGNDRIHVTVRRNDMRR